MPTLPRCRNPSNLLLYGSDIAQPLTVVPDRANQASKHEWSKRSIPSSELHSAQAIDLREICGDSSVTVVTASAKRIRQCLHCKDAFTDAFCLPKIWWEDYCKRSNGYCGYEMEADQGGNIGHIDQDTWVFFEFKQVTAASAYQWFKLNIFTRWIPSSKQTVVIVFDSEPFLTERILGSLKQFIQPNDPLWTYAGFCNELVRLQDNAVWAIRDKIREIEEERQPVEKPRPDYRRLHDIARHAIHVTETLEVASQIIDGIILHHETVQPVVSVQNNWQMVHNRLLFFRSLVASLRLRSGSNEKRLANEIQLAFNTVAQYDSGISVQIGKATQTDSAAMKTIASLTLIFLPPTFVCAIFSMSFFSFDTGAGWGISGKFWIYWAFAAPITLLTSFGWYIWQKRVRV